MLVRGVIVYLLNRQKEGTHPQTSFGKWSWIVVLKSNTFDVFITNFHPDSNRYLWFIYNFLFE
jgi:hypothetical protein